MAFRSSSTSSTSVTGGSFTVPVPAGTTTNDIVFLFYTDDGGNHTIGWPSGFTELDHTYLTGDGQNVGCAWKRQGATPDSGSYTISGAPSGSDPRAIAVTDSGRDTTNLPVLGAKVSNNSGNASPVTVSVSGLTAVLGDDLLFCMAPDTHAGVSQVFTAPSGFIDAVSEGTGASWSNEQVSIKENVGSGATGTISGSFTCTGTVAGYQGYLIRVPAGTTGPNTGAASGTIALSGSASGSRSSSGSASGSLSTSGTATGSRPSEGSATGTMTLAGSASGQQPANTGAASAAITVAGAGTGSRTASGTAAGALTLSGSASGTAPVVGGSGGAASGLLTLLGSASGSRASSGAATGAVSVSGAATGARASAGAASGSVALSGLASGQAPIPGMHQGTAAGIIVVLGDASGSRMSSGSASGTLTLISTAAGQDPPNVGAASGTLLVAGAATGTNIELRNLTVLAVVAVPRTTTVRSATRQTTVRREPSNRLR